MRKFFLPLLLIANITFGQVDLNLGLRAYYPFSGNANDISGNNNNPVFNNATLTADRFGNPNSAYHFNGIDKYMRIPNHATLNMGNTMSISLWVKPTGYNTGQCYTNMLVMKSSPATLQSNYHVRFGDIYNGCTSPNPAQERFSGNNAVAQTPFVQLNQWYSVVWTSDGVTEKIYVNCVLRESVPAGGIAYTNTFDLLFGLNVNPSFPFWLDGDLDEVRLYNRALNQDEVNALGDCITPVACNNWLNTPSYPSYATAGDLDVSGNQITIEATYNRTEPLNGGLYPGHLVSKHTDVSNVNYALFPNGCAITTTNGYKETFETCGLTINKTYHVAMVYDGSFLKFYRNGFLLTQVACTGNMILNNLPTTIAQYAGINSLTTQFMGYVNEVRIWNVARTQAQIQTYMNSSLPNPTTTPGLLGYYTFDNLLNKQGNAAFNASLVGPATINTTNTSCTFIADSCVVPVVCNNWLRTQVAGQSVTVGDLDIGGNQITIEGNFNCNAFPPPANGNIWEEIVSKHSNPGDCNYALRMNLGAITTTNGFFRTPPIPCEDVSLNKTYHAAMVYDGTTLKFYRDGFLRSQIAASGNLILNNWLTTIGDYADNTNPVGTNFKGYLNEIRIWNVARTQAQLRTYMDASLPNPTTQTGLLAYYTFDNLLNKQGNTTWNGNLNGAATINNTNPNCTFVADSCVVPVPCNNWLSTPSDPSYVTAGDIDVTGNKLTVEAVFNRTAPPPVPGSYGFLVSKHLNASDNNYALWPNGCALTTSTNPQAILAANCDIELNKTYHVAMVYDGVNLKFYRNGFLHSQTPMSGNLITNNLLTQFARNPIGGGPLYQFLGNMNEVRIWNVARTQSQLQTYMDASLPNPTTQTGLLAYYTFDNLLNKQGNAAFNATLNGAASINATNPNCTFVADSCVTIVSNENCKGVINLHGNDCVRLPLSQDYYANTGFTWETWFNSNWFENSDNTLRLGQSLIISEDAVLCEDIQLGFGWVNIPRNTIGFVVDAPGQCAARDNNPVFYKPPGGFLPNTWYHVAGVRNYSTNQTQLFFNGQLVDTKPNTGSPFSRNILTRIGTYAFAQDSGFAGKMDEIRIWKRARSAAEIAADYNKCLTGTETGLAAYYKSNEHNGLVLHNVVNNPSLNGTLDPTVAWNNAINAPLINNCGMPITTTLNITICRGLSYEGHTTSGTYTDTFPATNGCDSMRILNLTVLANIDSVRINHTNTCLNVAFNGLAYTNTSPINNWQWYFGDAGTANTQNTSHTYAAAGTYIVKLVVTDINGCKDSILKSVTVDICASVIINDYTPVLGFNPCDNKLTVENGTAYNVGDTVLLIQMKGAVIDSTNTAAFGTITDYKNSGNYEFNYVKSKAGNVIELSNAITRQYDISVGKVQLIRVPYYINLTTIDTLTCLPWDGSKGGVLAFNVQNTLTLNADLNVSGKGFKGGIGYNPGNATLSCFQNNYFYPINTIQATYKGESIAPISTNKICGKGNLAGGGGGGAGHNSGGGGGGNGGPGGFGGYQLNNCGSAPFDNRGIGGRQLAYSTASNRIFLGSGGGAGHADNPGNIPPAGGNGAGIIIVNADKIQSNSKKIIANGSNGLACSVPSSPDCHDAMGGGGAGGTVLLSVNQYLDNSIVENKGGKGADVVSGNIAAAGRIGPGGGGGGGLAFLKSAGLPANLVITNTGGLNGVLTQDGNNPWGAMSGTPGQNLFNLVLPVDLVPFKPNIDSVRIKDSITACLNVDFKGFAYTNTNPISTWQWYFGDAGTANTQNTSHTYGAAGTFIVKLVVTDINGCKDSILKSVTVNICATVIINDYTPVLGFNPCDNKLTVEDGTAYNVGDTVLLIQMKGAIIDSTNTAAFGTITDYKNAGNYEFNYVKSKAGNVIELSNALTRQYDIPVGKVQLIRVPYYNGSLIIRDTLTCLPWDGSKGGVLALNVRDTLELNADINVSGKGFVSPAPTTNTIHPCNADLFYYNSAINGGEKGNGLADISASKKFGKGKLANAGGGGNSDNGGGGGGSNIAKGGDGGKQWQGCTPDLGTGNGIGGVALSNNPTLNKAFMGGSGGMGHTNDQIGYFPPGNGAGIVFIIADKLKGNAYAIKANGGNAFECPLGNGCTDGTSGGGGGGNIFFNVPTIINSCFIEVKGGKGADNSYNDPVNYPGVRLGTGGGGGAGMVAIQQPVTAPALTINVAGGVNGVNTAHSNDPHGATPGNNGIIINSFSQIWANSPFKTNIDSVRIKDSILSCNDFDFKGLAYINTNPIANWQWYFGDGGQANTQNTSHAYSAAGTYTVKLIVTDINGCMDSTLKDVNALPAVTADAGTDVSVCSNTTVSVTLSGTAVGGPYVWSPAAYLNNPTIQNPTATISSTTTFYLHVNGSATCTAIDSVTITINPVPLIDTRSDTAICRLAPLVLTTNSNAATYQWSPAANVSNPTIANPNYTGNTSGWMYVTGYFASGCSATDSLYVTVNPTPLIDTRSDTAICFSAPLVLNTNSDATTFQWSPAAYVSNPNIASPNYINNASGWVYVTGYFASGCSATDSLYVTVNPIPLVDTRTDTTICRFSPLVLNTNSNAATYQWSPVANVNNPNIANPNYTGNASGWVYVTGSSAAGCFAKDSLYVTVNPLPVVQTIVDTTICLAQNITLTTTGAQTYFWSPAIGLSNPNIASPVFIGSNGQTYTVTGTDANGCKNTDLVSISVILPGLFKAPPAFTICHKESVQLDGNNGSQVSYLWSPATYLSNATIINPLANPPQTTLYTLLVTDNRCGFDSTFTTLLTVVPAPVINAAKSNDIDCAFRSATLFASGSNQYLWSPSTGLSSTTIANPVAIPANTQTYTVLVTDATGCTNTDSVTVVIKKAASLARYMPNAFTPDGNGINDCYGLTKWMYVQKLQFYIFNRFGEQVFGTSNPNMCWDGIYKGKPALAGTYVFVIKAQTDCGLEEQKGTFLLIR